MRIVAQLIALLWALCILIHGLVDQPSLRMRASAPTRRRRPAGYEWRKVRQLGGRLVAVRVQVILA